MLIRRLFGNLFFPRRNPISFLTSTSRFMSTKQDEGDSKTITYTKSKAFQYKAYENFRMLEDAQTTVPSYNAFVLKISIAIFMIYFCYLREPNDIDDMLSRDLFEIVPELEIPILELEVKRLEKERVNVNDLKEKIVELKRLEEKKNRN